MNNHPDAVLEQQLRTAFGVPSAPDFDAWQGRHPEAIAQLNSTVTIRQRQRRKLLVWTARAAAALAAGIAGFVILNSNSAKESFAQAIAAAEGAQTVTSASTTYSRASNKDGSQTWLRKDLSTIDYQSPGHYRDTRFDQQGGIRSVEIVDLEQKKYLFLDMKNKKATWLAQPRNQYGLTGPLASAKILEHKDVQLVGQRKVGDATANVFRFHQSGGDHSSFDVWVDTHSKQLLGYSSPGADVFDPDNLPERNNPPGETFSGKLLGMVTQNIVVNAKLADDLFKFTIPEGFEVVTEPPPPLLTEAQLTEYLEITARFNGGTFFDTAKGPGIDLLRMAAIKKKPDRTEAEQKMVDLNYKYMMARHSYPIWDFADDNAVPKSFQYIGGGVKLGDASQIVCWYKSKSTGQYRAVYGDLSIKDVEPKDLPLPVDK